MFSENQPAATSANVVKPVTPESSEQAFDARCAMELGAAATTVGKVSEDRVAGLRKLMEDTEPLVSEGRFVDVNQKFCDVSKYSREELLGEQQPLGVEVVDRRHAVRLVARGPPS